MDTKRQSKTLSAIPTNANEKGIVLVATIALVALLALFGTLGIVATSTEIIISKNHKSSVQARYVTEAGIHRTVGMLNSSPGWIAGLADPTINAFPGDNSFGNGTYVVKVYEDDPTPGKIRILTTGDVNGSSSTFEAIITPQYYKILDYATFNCGNFNLKDSDINEINGGVFVSGNLDMGTSGLNKIQGDVYAMGNIIINGNSRITGGNAFTNGNIDLQSAAIPYIIDGTATAKGSVSGDWNKVSGDVYEGVTTAPVTDQCSETYLADITITSDDIQYFRDNADTTIDDDYTFNTGDNYTGIVHITENFYLTGNATFSGDVIFIVDGNVEITGQLTSNPPGSTVTFLVPEGNFQVMGGGSLTIDGTLLVGTVDLDLMETSGGSIIIKDGSDLTVNGSAIVVNGNTDAESIGGFFKVNYQSPSDSNLMLQGTYAMTQWREIRN